MLYLCSMISGDDYKVISGSAQRNGLVAGLVWTIILAFIAWSFKEPEAQLVAMVLMCYTPWMLYRQLRKFRDGECGGYISYGRALLLLALSVGYATVIVAAAVYIYFQFIDQGLMMSTLERNLAMPGVMESLQQAGLSREDLTAQLDIVAKARPIDMALSFAFNVFFSSLALSVLVALMGQRRRKGGHADVL